MSYTKYAIQTYQELKNRATSPEELIRWAVKEAWAYNEQSDQDFVTKLVDYYNGDQLDYLDEILQKNYKNNYKVLKPCEEVTNIVKPVINRLSNIYGADIEREVTIKDNKSENDDLLYKDIMIMGNFDSSMQLMNALTTLTGTMHMRFWIDLNGVPHFEPITRDYLSVLPSKHLPTQADAVWFTESILKSQFGEQEIVVSYWDNDNWYKFVVKGTSDNIKFSSPRIIEDEDNPNQINPYGVIPFVRLDTTGGKFYFNECNKDLVNTQDVVNQILTDYNYTIKMQSFSIPVLIGYTPTANEEIVISPGDPIVLPANLKDEQENKFYFETPQPMLKDISEEINNKLNRIAQARGLPSSTFTQTSDQSGFHLFLQNTSLMEHHAKERNHYEDFEKRLFELVKVVWNTIEPTLEGGHRLKGRRFNDNANLRIIIGDTVISDTQEEKRSQWEFELDYGLRTPVDYYMQALGMTREQAEEYWKEVSTFRGQRPLADTGTVEILEGI